MSRWRAAAGHHQGHTRPRPAGRNLHGRRPGPYALAHRTTNFASNLGWSSFTIALADADGPLLGVVADPYRDEVFTARRGHGARRNGEPVTCTSAASLAGTVLLTELNAHLPWAGTGLVVGAGLEGE